MSNQGTHERATHPAWESLRDLFGFAAHCQDLREGQLACFDLRLDGDFVPAGKDFLVRAQVLQQAHIWAANGDISVCPSTAGGKAVLRLRASDFYTLASHTRRIRAAWTVACCQGDVVILDATMGPAFLMGQLDIEKHEVVRRAEVFCGGFSGWSQAAMRMALVRVPWEVSWSLDHDPTDTQFEPHDAINPAVAVHCCIDKRLRAKFAVVLPVSPFFNALFDAGCRRAVESFRTHHVPMSQAAGAPQMTLAFNAQETTICGHSPSLTVAATTGLTLAFNALGAISRTPLGCSPNPCAHPPSATEGTGTPPLILGLGPILAFSALGATSRTPFGFSLNPCAHPPSATQTAGAPTPKVHLSLRLDRAFAVHALGAISLTHFGYSPNLCAHPPSATETPRLLLGLGPFFALSALGATSLTPFGFSPKPCAHPPSATQSVSTPRLKGMNPTLAFNALGATSPTLFGYSPNPCANPPSAKVSALAFNVLQAPSPNPFGSSPNPCAHPCSATQAAGTPLKLHISPGLDFALAFNALGATSQTPFGYSPNPCAHPPSATQAAGMQLGATSRTSFGSSPNRCAHSCSATQTPADEPSETLTLHTPLHVPWDVRPQPGAPVLVALTPSGVCCLKRHAHDFLAQLKSLFLKVIGRGSGDAVCLDVMGRPVPELEKLPAWTIVTSIDQVPMQPPQYAPSSVSATRVRRQGQGFCFQVPSAFAAHWCMHLPIALIEAMGWSVTFGAFPPRAVDRLQVSLQPKLAGFVISPESMQGLLRKQSFLGQLYQLTKTQPPGCPKVEVELQCQAETVAFTSLPAAMTVETILNCWRSASLFAGCWPKARVTSGPFPLPVERNLQTNGAQPLFRRKGSSRILLCVHVEHRGGGAKDDGVQLAKTRIASLLLDRGVSLHETTVVTDRLLDKLGASKCLALVKPTDPAQRWEDLA